MLLAKRRVMAAKVETTVGTAETLTATEGAFNIFEASMQPNINFNERQGQGVFSPLPGVLGAYGGTVSFRVEVHGSGSAGSPSPAWASTLLPACGLYDDSDVFKLESKAPAAGANTKTVTLGVFEDGLYKKLAGCMGNAVFNFTAGQVASIDFTFTGIWADPEDSAIIAPTYPTVIPPRVAGVELTIGSWSPVFQSLSFDLGNEVTLREDAQQTSGYISAVITGRRITGTINPEATLVATHDIYGDWKDGTEAALAFAVGSGSADGNCVDVAAPKLQWTNVQEGDREGINIDEGSFQLNRSVAAGDDELTITFS